MLNIPRSEGSLSWMLRLANGVIGFVAGLIALWLAGQTNTGGWFIFAFGVFILGMAIRDIAIASRLWRT